MNVTHFATLLLALVASLLSLYLAHDARRLAQEQHDELRKLHRRLREVRENREGERLAAAEAAASRSIEIAEEARALVDRHLSEFPGERETDELPLDRGPSSPDVWEGYRVSPPFLTAAQLPAELVARRELLETDLFLDLGDGRIGWLRARDEHQRPTPFLEPGVAEELLRMFARKEELQGPDNSRNRVRQFENTEELREFLTSDEGRALRNATPGTLPDGTPCVFYPEGGDAEELQQITERIRTVRKQSGISMIGFQAIPID